MRRYLVNMGGMPMSRDDWNKGSGIWEKTLSVFEDIKDVRVLVNLSEGHIVCLLEAPSADRIRQLFDSLGTNFRESGLFPDMPEMPENEKVFDIWPIELEYEGSNIVYQVEPARV